MDGSKWNDLNCLLIPYRDIGFGERPKPPPPRRKGKKIEKKFIANVLRNKLIKNYLALRNEIVGSADEDTQICFKLRKNRECRACVYNYLRSLFTFFDRNRGSEHKYMYGVCRFKLAEHFPLPPWAQADFDPLPSWVFDPEFSKEDDKMNAVLGIIDDLTFDQPCDVESPPAIPPEPTAQLLETNLAVRPSPSIYTKHHRFPIYAESYVKHMLSPSEYKNSKLYIDNILKVLAAASAHTNSSEHVQVTQSEPTMAHHSATEMYNREQKNECVGLDLRKNKEKDICWNKSGDIGGMSDTEMEDEGTDDEDTSGSSSGLNNSAQSNRSVKQEINGDVSEKEVEKKSDGEVKQLTIENFNIGEERERVEESPSDSGVIYIDISDGDTESTATSISSESCASSSSESIDALMERMEQEEYNEFYEPIHLCRYIFSVSSVVSANRLNKEDVTALYRDVEYDYKSGTLPDLDTLMEWKNNE